MASRNDWHVDDLVQEEEEFWDIARLAVFLYLFRLNLNLVIKD